MRLAPHFDNHKKCIFETLPNEIKCVLRIKESNFDDKIDQFLHLLLVRAEDVKMLIVYGSKRVTTF